MNTSTTRISVPRVLLALCLVTALAAGGYLLVRDRGPAADATPHWFAGYVDVTALPRYAFEAGVQARETTDRLSEGATAEPGEERGRAIATHDVILSFIVDHGAGDCTPSWGTYHTLEEAGWDLDLDRRIERLREAGASVLVSFGGALNSELAAVCSTPEELAAAYGEVVERYRLDTIDLDIEGPALTDTPSILRRAEAVASLQAERRAAGEPLAVWLTLPVLPTGLTDEAIAVVVAMLDAGVDLAGVNLMTMNYGEARGEMSMAEASGAALAATHRQLGILYEHAGIPLGDASLWEKLGATPMIGQNDVAGEVFGLDDARSLNAFALGRGVGRMSMWSLNRDITCGPNYPHVNRVSDSCSGVEQGTETFHELLSAGYSGRSDAAATATTSPEPDSTALIVDDPATSPYPIWSEKASYLEGTKIVWRQYVYQAKWWTSGDVPDDPVLQLWDTPWELVGPVLPGETPAPPLTLPEGTYPEWNGEDVYQASDRVLLGGTPYEAKWWTQADTPELSVVDPDGSPWRALTAEEVRRVLEPEGEH